MIRYEKQWSDECQEEVLVPIEVNEFDEDECTHERTEMVGVDDDRWMGADHEIHERSNPDVEHCLDCGKYYNPKTEDWEDE